MLSDHFAFYDFVSELIELCIIYITDFLTDLSQHNIESISITYTIQGKLETIASFWEKKQLIYLPKLALCVTVDSINHVSLYVCLQV